MKIYSTLSFLLVLMAMAGVSIAQTTISTTSIFSNNNGSGTVTFNLQNCNSTAVTLTQVKGVLNTSSSVPVEVWYKTTPISGAPGVISVANGWTRIDSTNVTGLGTNTSTTTTQQFFSNLNFTLPANTTYGFAIYGQTQRYYSIPTTTTTTATTKGGVSIITGFNVSYGGGAPNGAAPGNALRGWIGELTFVPAAACSSPPTPGTTTASSTTLCGSGSINLDLCGSSIGTSQTYQLQFSTTLTGTYSSVGSSQSVSSFTATPTTTGYYKIAVTCGTSTLTSVPVLITVSPGLSGTYTINKAAPTGGTNYNSFTDAVAALSCGVAGPVTFNVVPGSGPFNEQVVIPPINGTSATNTVTFNGNGDTLTYNSTTSASRAGIFLDGADWITIKNLTVIPTGTYGFAIQMMNGADNNTVSGCTMINTTTASGTGYAGIVISGSATSATSSGSDCDSNKILNNTIIGGYYAITDLGDATLQSKGNLIKGNTISDFYFYGIYLSYNVGTQVDSNDISRATRANTSTFYGVYLTTTSLSNVISRNRIHNTNDADPTSTSVAAGIYNLADGTAGNENLIVNNLIYNFNGAGAQYGLYNSSGPYSKYYHNTVSLDDASSTASAVTRGFYQTGAAVGIDIRNNIFSLTRSSSGAKTVLYFGTSTSVIKSDYNDLYLTTGSSSTNDIGYFGGRQTTHALWKAQGFDSNSVLVNPQFALPASGDFTPTNMAMSDTGYALGILIDINGNSRKINKPDLGAVEFSPPCLAPGGLSASNVLARKASINWSMVSLGVGYQYVVSTTRTTPTAAGTATSGTSAALTGLLPATKYYYYVRTVCNDNGLYYSPYTLDSFTTCTPPPNTITAAPGLAICAGTTTTLNAPTGTGLSYQFLLNDADINGATSASYTTGNAGIYRVYVSSATCGDTSAPVTVSVNALPTISVSPTAAASVCTGGSIALTASGAVTYTWSPSSGLSAATGATVTATPTGTTTYTVTGTDANGCINSGSKMVTVNPLPTIVVSPATATAICSGVNTSVTLTASGASTYSWTPAASLSSATGASVTASPTTATTYTVTGTDANGCMNTATKTVNVSTPPTVTVSPASSTICSGVGNVVLTASGAATYSWSPATDLSAATGASVTASPNSTTIYSVTGTNTAGCSSTVTSTVNVDAAPALSISPATAVAYCAGGSATLTASGTATSYTWSPATGLNTTTGTTVTASPAATTTYTLTGTNANGCTTTVTKTVTVNPLPLLQVSPSGATAICRGSAATLTASGATTYSWSPATGLSATSGSTVSAAPTANTTYTITGTDINGCTASTTKSITVNAPPIVSISPGSASVICAGSSVTLIGGGASTYSWTPATGLSATTGISVNASPATTTTYTLTGTDGNGCSAVATKTITVNQRPGVSISPSTAVAVCAGAGATLTASGASTYVWSPATGLSATTGATVTATPSLSTTYTVTGTDANGCTNTANRLVSVLGRPTINTSVSGTGTICPGSSIGITATGAQSYSWSPSGSLSASTGASVTASPAVTTTYTVTGTAANGCTNTASRTITVHPLPVSDITPSGYVTLCQNDSVTLTAATGYQTYKWMIFGTVIASANTHTLTTGTGGFYTLEVTDAIGCTSTTVQPTVITIIQRPTPVITLTGITLVADGGYHSYSWYRNGIAIPGANGQSYTPVQGGLYTVEVTTSGSQCAGVSQAYQYTGLGVGSAPGIAEAIRIYPNPSHDMFYIDAPLAVDVTVSAMDGKIIYRGTDVRSVITRSWPDGVYQVVLRDKQGAQLKTEKLSKISR